MFVFVDEAIAAGRSDESKGQRVVSRVVAAVEVQGVDVVERPVSSNGLLGRFEQADGLSVTSATSGSNARMRTGSSSVSSCLGRTRDPSEPDDRWMVTYPPWVLRVRCGWTERADEVSSRNGARWQLVGSAVTGVSR